MKQNNDAMAFIIKPGYPLTINNREEFKDKTDVQRTECFALAKVLYNSQAFADRPIMLCEDIMNADTDIITKHSVDCAAKTIIDKSYASGDIDNNSVLFVVCSLLDETTAVGKKDKAIICNWPGVIIWCYWDLRLPPKINNWSFKCSKIVLATQADSEQHLITAMNAYGFNYNKFQEANDNIIELLLDMPFYMLPAWYKKYTIDDNVVLDMSLQRKSRFKPTIAFPIVNFKEYAENRQILLQQLLLDTNLQMSLCGNIDGLDLINVGTDPIYVGTIKTEQIEDWYKYADFGLVLQDELSYNAGAIMFRAVEIALACVPVIAINAHTPFNLDYVFDTLTHLERYDSVGIKLKEYSIAQLEELVEHQLNTVGKLANKFIDDMHQLCNRI